MFFPVKVEVSGDRVGNILADRKQEHDRQPSVQTGKNKKDSCLEMPREAFRQQKQSYQRKKSQRRQLDVFHKPIRTISSMRHK